MAFFEGGVAPACRVFLGDVDNLPDLLTVGLRHFADAYFIVLAAVHVFVALLADYGFGAYLQGDDFGSISGRLLPSGEDVPYPFLVLRQVEVCVRFVLHRLGGRYGGVVVQTVLCACGEVGDGIFHAIGIFELLFEEVPGLGVRFQVEGVRQEVVGRGVLVHAAHQVRYGVQEVLVLYYGGVEDDVVAEDGLCTPYVVGHTFQHFEGHVFGRAVLLTQQIGVCDSKQIVRSYADVERLCVFGQQGALQDVQVVGVYFGLGGTYRVGPAAQGGDDGFHFEVTALHEAHLERSASVGYACTGKFQQFGLEVVSIGQVGLHYDTRFVVLELGQAEYGLEEAQGEVRVFVLLHVEVDELGAFHTVLVYVRVVYRPLVEGGHAAYQFGETFFVIQGMRLGVDAGYLDGDVVDVGSFECFEVVLIAVVGFSVAQYDFAQKIYVLAYLLLEAFGKVFRQLRARFIEDHFGGVHAEALLYNRYGDEVEVMSEGLVHLEEEGIALVQEFGHAVAVYQGFDAGGKFLAVAYLRGFVEHLHQEAFVLGALHHDGVLMLFFPFFVRDGLFTSVIELQYPVVYFGDGGFIFHIVSMFLDSE